jgi:hypothetical protein
MSVSCECCVLSGRGLCDGLVTHPEESCRVWCVWVCVTMKPRRNEEAQAHIGLSSHRKKERKKNSLWCPWGTKAALGKDIANSVISRPELHHSRNALSGVGPDITKWCN